MLLKNKSVASQRYTGSGNCLGVSLGNTVWTVKEKSRGNSLQSMAPLLGTHLSLRHSFKKPSRHSSLKDVHRRPSRAGEAIPQAVEHRCYEARQGASGTEGEVGVSALEAHPPFLWFREKPEGKPPLWRFPPKRHTNLPSLCSLEKLSGTKQNGSQRDDVDQPQGAHSNASTHAPKSGLSLSLLPKTVDFTPLLPNNKSSDPHDKDAKTQQIP